MGNSQSASTPTKRDLQIVAETSGKSEEQIVRWYNDFRRDSRNADRMDKRQFQTFYAKLRNRPNLPEITDHIFRAFDLDQSGTIDFNEFLIAYIATSEGKPRQKFTYMFEVYDINDNQTIERREAKKIVNIICRLLDLSDRDARMYTDTLMLSFDDNRDKVLSKDEFVEGCLHDRTLAGILSPFDV